MRALRAGAVVLAIVAGGWATRVAALSSYYTSECQTCHGAPPAGVNTCAGCHSHGTHSTSSKTDINVSAALNKSTFTPGETMTITVTGGYRDGWARVVLLDDGMHEVARSSCGTPGSGPPTPCATSSFVNHTLTMSQAAPTAAGAHNWAVAWYGNYSHEGSGASFGASANAATLTPGSFTPDASNTGHGYQVVSVPSFTVAAATAPAIAVDPTSLSFGNVAVGSHLAKSITIQNTGTSALTVSNVALGSGTSAEYTISQTSVVVNPSESHAVTITYAPTDTTTDSGSILITSDDPAHATTTVSVSGTGTTAPNATASVDPASVAFGDVTVGANSAKTITVSNAGNAALTGTVALGSGTSSEYTFTPAALNVAAGASQTVTITYAPTDETTDTGQLVLTTNDPAHATIGVALSGNGVTTTAPKITVTPASLDFGTIAQGTTKQLTAQITNGGNGTLNVTAVDRCTSPATSDEFTWSPAAPLNIAAGQSATLTVTYTANDLATEVGCLAITSNDQQSAITNLNVTGTGQASSTSGATGSGGATTTHSSSGCSTGEGSGSFAALALVAILALRRARRVDRPGSGS